MMSDIGSNCHYFAYELALKYSFEVNLLREMKSCPVIVRYEHCDRKEKQLYMRHCQMVTHPSTNPIRRRLTPKTRSLGHRSAPQRSTLDTRTGRQCKPFMTHISSSISKYNISTCLRIVSKPNTATREYRKKSAQLTKYVQRRLMYPLGTYF